MDKYDLPDDLRDDELSELYETPITLLGDNSKNKKSFFTIPMLVLLLLLLSNSSNVGFNKTLGELLKIKTNTEPVVPTNGTQEVEEIVDFNGADVEHRLQKGDLLGDIVKDYFMYDYGLDVTVVDIVDVTEGVLNEDILKVITVKDNNSGSAYEFKYYKSGDTITITDSYGTTLTSNLLGEKLTEYYSSRLPEGSSIWVESESLGHHSKVLNSKIEYIIKNSSIEELLDYVDEVALFKGIGVNIVEKQDILSHNVLPTDYVSKYKDIFIDIDDKLGNEISPKLDVVFLRGDNGKTGVISYLEQKIGLANVGGSFYVNWYNEIPMMGEEARNNILGAMSIKGNITDVILDYCNKGISMYLDKETDTYISVYSSVDDILQSSIATEQRAMTRLLK